VECEDYADTLTAERVRRVINGYEFQGTQKEELFREKLTLKTFKKAKDLLRQIQAIEDLNVQRFDTITKTTKDGELMVTGEKRITERMEGLGGGFNYYTLGEPLDLDKLLTGELLPDYASIGAWLFHTATGEPLCQEKIDDTTWYLGESTSYHVWLVYKPDLDFLKSREAALTLSLAEKISRTHPGKRHLVFAPARFAPNTMLAPLGVEHAPLPFALYRFETD
jgi:adenine-specific DNA-methyltransferase